MSELLLDMDGVIVDTMQEVFNRLKERGIADLIHADVTDYWFKGMSVEAGVILDIMREPGFYTDLKVITGAVGAINRLRESHDVSICTAPLKGAETCAEEKYDWILRNFDKDFAESTYIVGDKTPIPGDFLLEDNPHIDGKNASWSPIMFDQPWNRNVNLPRMYGWGDIGIIC